MLDKRQQKILKTVVYKFITTGTPVGSKSLAQGLNLGVSAATIRNELSKLEGLGYLYQPHTSAGRVPTDLGYRFYVDSLSGRTRLREGEKNAILTLFSHKTKELENLLQETSTLLSRLTSAAAMVIAPRLRRNTIKHVDLVNLAEEIVLLVIITDTGRVEKKLVDVKDCDENIELEEIQSFLNFHLQGKGLDKVADLALHRDLKSLKSPLLAARVIGVIRDILSQEEYEKVYVGGTVNLLRYLDGEGIQRIERLLEHFEQVDFRHVPREQNRLADALANRAMDRGA